MSGLSPISFEFVAAGVARRARVALAHLVPSQVNKEVPSWKGHDGTIEGAEVATPITDRTFWESRYVLTELILCKENGEVPEEALTYKPRTPIEQVAFDIFTDALHDSLMDEDDE